MGCKENDQITTFILLRHAEKGNDGTEDPDLSLPGIERAERLKLLLRETEINGIYATQFKRTKNTVAPLALAKNLDIQSYESFKAEEIEKMLDKHQGGTVVICGHSNNIPWTANLLLGKETYKDYTENEYGIMLILSVVKKGKVAKVTRLDW
ncbi:phosphoglycerate mutase family protein [Chryseolinea sp. H1M3-3]|uniref:SixA phosphatase family protein n=1 Tax=Chryseolinea sp. H1M3-3 TaxID=3034144 RepID=UPI0023EC4205|nr:phosphoglycerate mutase family protein [Chryseolinea sp. H1M3-3]